MNKIDKNQFENHEEYIKALENLGLMQLKRRQLQDLGSHYMTKARENKDWEMAEKAIYFYDLSINLAGSKAEAAMQAVKAMLMVLPNDEEGEKIDQVLAEIEGQHQRKAQSIYDRMNAEEEQNNED